jgi:hypothetical protein
VFELNATVTALTDSTEEISHAPAMPSIILSLISISVGKIALNVSMYTFLKKVANKIKSISGVINEIKNINLFLK